MLRYAITDGSNLPDAGQRWAKAGVDFVQVRAKHLDAGDLLQLVLRVREQTRGAAARSGRVVKLLVNGRADVAIAAGADGVHLTAHPDELTPEQVWQVFAVAGLPKPFMSVSTHSIAEVQIARACGADIALFGPVFEKRVDGAIVSEGVGLAALRGACDAAGNLPVLALGGVTLWNTAACTAAGAAGIAGIRLFG